MLNLTALIMLSEISEIIVKLPYFQVQCVCDAPARNCHHRYYLGDMRHLCLRRLAYWMFYVGYDILL